MSDLHTDEQVDAIKAAAWDAEVKLRREISTLRSRLGERDALLAKIGKKMNDPLLSQRERIMIAEDIRRQLEAPQETKP